MGWPEFYRALAAIVCGVLLAGFAIPVKGQLTDPAEVSALQAIRKNLVDPYKNLRTWSNGDPCTSNWTGVLCFNASKDDGYLHVQELQLFSMNLSGTLAPAVGKLSYMEIFDVMWNQISGAIPKEIGNVKSLILLLVNGNRLTGPLPDEIGSLPNLNRIQIDQNSINGPIPSSFGNLNKTQHFHMNNNSLSGQIPPELSRLPNLVHLLLDNNNLTGYLPPELAQMPKLLIIQLDNNQFTGASIPSSYITMSKLLKLSLRNCSLQGSIPDFSSIAELGYLDLSWNSLSGAIPTNGLSKNITTIDLSHNNLNGTIPVKFSELPLLQRLSLNNNGLSGSIPSVIWQNRNLSSTDQLIVDLQNNLLSNASGSLDPPANVTIRLYGNPVCSNGNLLNISQYCLTGNGSGDASGNQSRNTDCLPQSCPSASNFEYVPSSPVRCFCAAPIKVGYRLKSPGFSTFPRYEDLFDVYLTSGLRLDVYQLNIGSFVWEEGPRLRMYLKLYPQYSNYSDSNTFNVSEILRIRGMFTGWSIPDSMIFGPYELLNFTLEGPYANVILNTPTPGMGKGVLAAVILGSIAVVAFICTLFIIIVMQRRNKSNHEVSRKRSVSKISIKIDGVKDFTFDELAQATDNFSSSAEIGHGGFGIVYKGTLADGVVVAIKRSLADSLQGQKEFLTEIELLSRCHHRNLVSLIGYCSEDDEQMLVYEYMPKGTLRENLSAKTKQPLNFAMRLRIAVGASRGIQYLHNEANPPIFHRDIKSSNILLDAKYVAKVADFGLSKLAPVLDLDESNPGVSTMVKGTPGYLDPEYLLTHRLTDKSDVYSLGVVFLEILTGMHPISHGKNIVRETSNAYQAGAVESIIDKQMGYCPTDTVELFAKLAIRCCHEQTEKRPSITEVVRELEDIYNITAESGLLPSTVFTPSVDSNADVPSSSVSSLLGRTNYSMRSDVAGSDLQSGSLPYLTPR